MILKIKAFIYRHTGIFLAQKEQDLHMNSEEVLEKIARTTVLNKMTHCFATDIEIGSWQCDNGFYRILNFKDIK